MKRTVILIGSALCLSFCSTLNAAGAPDDGLLKYIPESAAFYAMIDVKGAWPKLAPSLPPEINRNGRPAVPDPQAQKLLDAVWSSLNGPICLGVIGTGPQPDVVAVIPVKGNSGKSLLNDIVAAIRGQAGPMQMTTKKISGIEVVTLAPGGPMGGGPMKATGKMSIPGRKNLMPGKGPAMGGPPVDKILVALPSGALVISNSEQVLTGALKSGSRGIAGSQNFAAARTRMKAGTSQILWLWGRLPQLKSPNPFEVSVRAERGGLSFTGYVPLPGK